nr:PEF-CTERM sorting domain-containing protein [uncultured Methanolobus sp.]
MLLIAGTATALAPPCSDGDEDEDGVCDCNDICPGYNDKIDTDRDGVPDGCDSCPEDPTNTCQNNGIPEFPTIAIPIAAIVGLAFIFQHRRN